jgi:hypothetical protein
MMCSNFARCQVQGNGDGSNFLMSGTSGKGDILFNGGQNGKFYNYSHHKKLTVTLILFLPWFKILTEKYHLEFLYVISTKMALEI